MTVEAQNEISVKYCFADQQDIPKIHPITANIYLGPIIYSMIPQGFNSLFLILSIIEILL